MSEGEPICKNIIKALRDGVMVNSQELVYVNTQNKFAVLKLPSVAGFIEDQQAEIERLQSIIDDGAETCDNCHSKYAQKNETAKAEAIKEFAVRLRTHWRFCGGVIPYDEIHETIDDLVKETVGEQK